jgi:putative flavoprotein involved in K+ transport
MAESVETIVVGAGQAGLAISYWLTRAGRPHLVLERTRHVGSAWRDHRWDSFTLVTPNFQVRMPGAEYDGPAPYGFMTRAEVVCYLDDYAARFRLPIRFGVTVTAVEPNGLGYAIQTDGPHYQALDVVVATGLYQTPRPPIFAAELPAGVLQIHTMHYRNPGALPPGAVLVVGTGQSGAQIAEELYQSGRRVYLSIGGAGRVPRRYRGRDINDWLTRLGEFDTDVESLPSPHAKFEAHPQISGKNGGESLNLHKFVRDGVTLLGHAIGAHDGNITFAPDLYETLAKVDRAEVETLLHIDAYVARTGDAATPETIPQLRDGYAQPIIEELDLAEREIATVVWATGYGFDFSLVKLPVVDADGYPIQQRGVTQYEGLYFLGMPWLHNRRSGLLFGVGDDAAYLAAHMRFPARAGESQPANGLA